MVQFRSLFLRNVVVCEVCVRLRLEFPDEHRPWAELVKANPDRVFIETPVTAAKLGRRVPLELTVGGVLLLTVADLVGMRVEGGRFKSGVWVRLGDDVGRYLE
jgi:hypothetical protein